MHAQQPLCIAVDEQLTEALGAAVDDGPVQVGVGDCGHNDGAGDVRHFLGQTYAGVFGIGETAVGNDVVAIGLRRLAHGVLGGDTGLVAGALHQHHATGDVTGGENVGRGRAQAAVHPHVVAFCLHPGSVKLQRVQIAQPAGREHDGLGVEGVAAVSGIVSQSHVAAMAFQTVDAVDAGDDLDLAALKSICKRRRDHAILGRHDARGHVQEGDPTAKGGEDGGKLAAGGGSAHDDNRSRQSLQRPHVAVRQSHVRTREVQAAGASTGAEDEAVGLQTQRLAHGDGVWVQEVGLTLSGHHADPGSLQVGKELLLLMHLVNDVLGAGEQGREVQFREGGAEAIVAKLFGVARQSRRLGQHARGHAAIVGAGAPQIAAFHERDVCAQLAGAQGGSNPGRAAADDDEMKHDSWLPESVGLENEHEWITAVGEHGGSAPAGVVRRGGRGPAGATTGCPGARRLCP